MQLPLSLHRRSALLRAVARGDVLTVRHEGSERVVVLMRGVAVIDTTPESALEKAAMVRASVKLAEDSGSPTIVFAGQHLPRAAGVELAKGLTANARLAIEKRPRVAEQLAIDSAILLRAGVPVGLSNHPKILAMAKTEAESNRDLRRYMPGGIKSEVQWGTPAVRTRTPFESALDSLRQLQELEGRMS